MDNTIGDELKKFQRCTQRIRTRIMDLQDALAMISEAVKKAADVMELDMHDGLDDVLGAIEQARKHASPVKKNTNLLSNVTGAVSSSMSRVSRFNFFTGKKEQGKQEAGEEAKEEDGPTEVANAEIPDLAAMRDKIMQCEKKLNGHTEMVLNSLNQVPTPSPSPSPSPAPAPAPSPAPRLRPCPCLRPCLRLRLRFRPRLPPRPHPRPRPRQRPRLPPCPRPRPHPNCRPNCRLQPRP